jgi:FeS assembly protein IscX
MGLKWEDARAVALALCEQHPEVSPLSLRFTDLHRFVCQLPGFDDQPARSNEKLLEAIQMAWLDEAED